MMIIVMSQTRSLQKKFFSIKKQKVASERSKTAAAVEAEFHDWKLGRVTVHMIHEICN